MNNISIYLKVLDAVTLTQSDLEDFHRGHVGSQSGQALLSAAPDPNQQTMTPWRLQDTTDATASNNTIMLCYKTSLSNQIFLIYTDCVSTF